ncbi:hypothetical protein SAMN05216188_104105 [Lentzea xinjiangensis]|uniref:Uncharacterized protein n=1 Tax=Lentzea xinjiangensis TaxID=402600 RepID=A0A1H9HM73_9PSEU|nr:hypothetical protein SAMN05216188_104105 [Lentzea xinjiangensis]
MRDRHYAVAVALTILDDHGDRKEAIEVSVKCDRLDFS